MNTSKVKALACANRCRQRVMLWIFYFLAGRRRVKMYVYRERGLQQCSGGTVATRWRGFTLHSHSCSPARSSGESLGRRDSKTHLPSHTIHCGQQNNVSEEDFFLSSLCGLSKSKAVNRPMDVWYKIPHSADSACAQAQTVLCSAAQAA